MRDSGQQERILAKVEGMQELTAVVVWISSLTVWQRRRRPSHPSHFIRKFMPGLGGWADDDVPRASPHDRLDGWGRDSSNE